MRGIRTVNTTRPAHLRRSVPSRRSRSGPAGRPSTVAKRPGRPAAGGKPHVEAARRIGRRRLSIVAGLASLAALTCASLAVAHTSLFSARDVRVLGATHGEERAILTVSGLSAHPPLIDIDPSAADHAVERLPWIATARVTVSFPWSAAVTVVERVPVAFVPLPTGGALVDASGRVLADVLREPADIVKVEYAAEVPRPGRWFGGRERALFAVAAQVPLSLVGRITDITWSRRDGVVVDLQNAPLAILGSVENARAKFVALATVLADVSLAGIATIDLRAPSNPVLTP
jgi:cell division septal protein FtsQ